MTTVWLSRMILVESLCRKSSRQSLTLTYALATFRRAFSWLLLPFFLRDRFCCARSSLSSARFRYLGLSTFSPSLVMAKCSNRSLPSKRRIGKLAACRPSGGIVERNVLSSLKTLASSWRELHDRADVLECRTRQIPEENARPLLDVYCMGTMSAAQLAVIGGDNPERIRSEAAFAKLCGACPLPASSGKTNRHRLNRSGNRQGNRALYNVALVRMGHHQPTKDYVVRKTKEGKGKLEIMRCLKRYIAREVYRALIAIRNGEAGREPAVERGARLREVRVSLGKTQQQVGDALGVPSSRVSEIERGVRDLPELERQIIEWMDSILGQSQHSNTFDNV